MDVTAAKFIKADWRKADSVEQFNTIYHVI